jgi:hypothetical protein
LLHAVDGAFVLRGLQEGKKEGMEGMEGMEGKKGWKEGRREGHLEGKRTKP